MSLDGTDQTTIPLANVKAIAHFIGKDDEKTDLRKYENWYSTETITHLIHCQPKKGQQILRAYLLSETYIGLSELIINYRVLCNELKRPGLFILQEPEGGQHFIFVVVYNGKLLVINPLGKTRHQDMVTAFENTRAEVIYSKTLLQKDAKGIVSCGPLCVSLMHHFTTLNISDLFENLIVTNENGKNYTDIIDILPPMLTNLITADEQAYQKALVKIRQQHLQCLVAACRPFKNERRMNNFFDETCMNSHEQVLVHMFVTDKTFNIFEFSDNPHYQALEKEGSTFISPVKQTKQPPPSTTRGKLPPRAHQAPPTTKAANEYSYLPILISVMTGLIMGISSVISTINALNGSSTLLAGLPYIKSAISTYSELKGAAAFFYAAEVSAWMGVSSFLVVAGLTLASIILLKKYLGNNNESTEVNDTPGKEKILKQSHGVARSASTYTPGLRSGEPAPKGARAQQALTHKVKSFKRP
ncbi:MAG: hypothetical protein ACHQJ6_01280 [Candidatus Berkiellales bacterium]